jgi:hypothetical protein
MLHNPKSSSDQDIFDNVIWLVPQPAVLQLNRKRGWWMFPARFKNGKKYSWLWKRKHENDHHRRARDHNWGMSNDPDQLTKDFSESEWRDKCGIGLPTGIINNLFVIEVDTIEGHEVDGLASLARLQKNYSELPATLMVRSPTGSLHYYFRHPGPEFKVKLEANFIMGYPGIDCKGDGGMVILPPSTRPDKDGAYEWVNNLPIAEAPQWLLSLVTETARPETEAMSSLAQLDPNDPYAVGYEADLEELMKAVEDATNDDLNWDEWNRLGMSIFSGFPNEDGDKAFDAFSQKSNKYDRKTTRQKWKAYFSSPPTRGLTIGTFLGHARNSWSGDDAPPSSDNSDAPQSSDDDTIEQDDNAAAVPRFADIPLPDGVDWTRPDGVLGEITDFTLRVSPQPNRPLAVGAALVTVSVLCGRWLYGPTGTGLGIYVIELADTGVGKDAPLSVPERVLRAAGLEHLHTTGKAFSLSAFEQMMIERPCCLATVDEIGASLFGRMSHRGANANEEGIRTFLQEMWSRTQSKGPFRLTNRARQLEKLIDKLKLENLLRDAIPRPNFTLFGASGPRRFWENIAPGSIQDGFLNRYLIIVADPRGQWQEVSEAADVVPQSIAEALSSLVPALVVTEGDLSYDGGVYDIKAAPEALDGVAHRLPWESNKVKVRADAFQKQVADIIDNNPEEKDLVSRVFETAIRLASIHAVSRAGREARVTMRDLDWGIALSLHAGRTLITSAERFMAENELESKFNRIRNLIMDAGLITRSNLLRQLRSISARERNDIIKHLIEEGSVKEVQIATKGRAVVGWKWL